MDLMAVVVIAAIDDNDDDDDVMRMRMMSANVPVTEFLDSSEFSHLIFILFFVFLQSFYGK